MEISDLLNVTHTVQKDLLRMIIGKEIGAGASRRVYELRHNAEYILKVEEGSYDFGNVLENELWNTVSYTDFAKWLAPVESISPCGTCLIMARTEPVPKDQLPKFVPDWLTDIKQSNWGLYKGRVVCHDYGLNMSMQNGVTKKVRRADWET